MGSSPLTFYEFFAGGGMARLGLGHAWRCLFANDFDAVKAQAYRANFGAEDLTVADVWSLRADDLPGRADLAWASSPCQDLSLAGRREGLAGARSSAFFGFWRLIEALDGQGRAPDTVVIENVAGLLTSHAGADFTGLCETLAGRGYRFGAVEADAALFLPQSRPRLFVVATRRPIAARLRQNGPAAPFHGPRLEAAFARLPDALKASWLWWSLPAPGRRNLDLTALLERDTDAPWRPDGHGWLEHLSPRHAARLATDGAKGAVGAGYRRIRVEHGRRVQRLELRFDGLAGCLRTPAGGSSRQMLVRLRGGEAQTRHLSPREAARLMGLPESYVLPARATAALKVLGDGVAVPVVRHLAEHLLTPLCAGASAAALAAE